MMTLKENYTNFCTAISFDQVRNCVLDPASSKLAMSNFNNHILSNFQKKKYFQESRYYRKIHFNLDGNYIMSHIESNLKYKNSKNKNGQEM